MITLLAMAAAGSSERAASQVNLLTGGLELRPELSHLPQGLKYKSRSLYRGLFGFGWCSDFDFHLEFDRGLRPILKHCDSTVISAQISRDKESWRAQVDKLTLQFDSYGRPKFDRSTEQKVVISSEPKLILQMRLGNQSFDFRYRGTNLISVHKNGKIIFSALYDDLHNLTSLRDQDGRIDVVYDQFEDRVQQIRYDSGCQDDFQYILDLKTKKERIESLRRCTNLQQLVSVVEADYSQDPLSPAIKSRSAKGQLPTGEKGQSFQPKLAFPTLFSEGVE